MGNRIESPFGQTVTEPPQLPDGALSLQLFEPGVSANIKIIKD